MNESPATTRLVGSFTKAADLQCHVRVVEIENVRVAEFRDFIPSLNEYGRGYWVPMTREAIFGCINALNDVASSETLP